MGSSACARRPTPEATIVHTHASASKNRYFIARILRRAKRVERTEESKDTINVVRWTDHKAVGLQYGLTALGFLLVGFLLMMLMRWQLAWPGQPLPSWLAMLLGDVNAPGRIMLPEFYNQRSEERRVGKE